MKQIQYKIIGIMMCIFMLTIPLTGCSQSSKDKATNSNNNNQNTENNENSQKNNNSEKTQNTESKNENYDYTGYTEYKEDGLGFTLKLPDKYINNETIIPGRYEVMFGDLSELDSDKPKAETEPDEHLDIFFMPQNGEYCLFKILAYPESKWDGWMNSGKKATDITHGSSAEEISRKDGTVYIYAQFTVDTAKFDASMKADYENIIKMLPAIKASIKITTFTADNLGSFSTKDSNSKTVDNTIFQGHKLTMINIWATFCKPCIKEMPDLQKMSEDMPEGTQLISIVGDVLDADTLQMAQTIIKDKKVLFTSIVPDASLKKYMDNNIIAYPTTIFVDSDGKVVGEPIVGERSISVYKQVLEERLAQVGN